jgi:hypothetical protein
VFYVSALSHSAVVAAADGRAKPGLGELMKIRGALAAIKKGQKAKLNVKLYLWRGERSTV